MSLSLHSGYYHSTLRRWQSSNTELYPHNFMLPIFIVEDINAIEDISSMPGIKRFGSSTVIDFLQPLVDLGLSSILLFGVPNQNHKDERGSFALSTSNPLLVALQSIKKNFPTLLVAVDICLCPYTSHGHCGILRENESTIDNDCTVSVLAEMATFLARNGADIVAPSDMMDGRIKAIKESLRAHSLLHKVSVLSYAVKFTSGFYGPFRDAAQSCSSTADRRTHQLPPGSRGLAHRAADRDVREGADLLMVKPGLPYLDLVRETKNAHPDIPLFVYQVSGEYSMLIHGANAGSFDLKTVLLEVLTSMRRAGADVIISYFTPSILKWIAESSFAIA